MPELAIRLAMLTHGHGYVIAWEQRDEEGWYDSSRVCWSGGPTGPFTFVRLHPAGQRIANVVRVRARAAKSWAATERRGEAVVFWCRADAEEALLAARAELLERIET